MALFSQDVLFAQEELAVGLNNSRTLLPTIERLLHKAHIEPEELSYVAVGHGPGSYTGIRVAVACAKALTVALDIPLIGVSSLRGFVPDDAYQGPFFACIDARIGGVYCIKGEKQGTISFIGEEALIPFEAFVELIQEGGLIVTPSREILETRLQKYLPQPHILERAASAEMLFHEAETHYQNKNYSTDGTLPLLYLRE